MIPTSPPSDIDVSIRANPSDSPSASALWAYIQPGLDHILKSPSNDSGGRAPAIDVGFYVGIHTELYNFMTSRFSKRASNGPPNQADENRAIYERLDEYFTNAVRELALGTPQDDAALIRYIITCFHRYNAGAQSVHRLLSYLNRHYIRCEVDEGRGWSRQRNIPGPGAKSTKKGALDEVPEGGKVLELKKWGYRHGGASVAPAEACAEAASLPDCVVPISSLAIRRFRTEFVEPLLAVPMTEEEFRGGSSKGRLARAVELQEGFEEGLDLAIELANSLRAMGVPPDHPLRKQLDEHITSVTFKFLPCL